MENVIENMKWQLYVFPFFIKFVDKSFSFSLPTSFQLTSTLLCLYYLIKTTIVHVTTDNVHYKMHFYSHFVDHSSIFTHALILTSMISTIYSVTLLSPFGVPKYFNGIKYNLCTYVSQIYIWKSNSLQQQAHIFKYLLAIDYWSLNVVSQIQ